MPKKKENRQKIEYKTQIFHGVQIICKNWMPKDMMLTVSTPDERGIQEVVITKLEPVDHINKEGKECDCECHQEDWNKRTHHGYKVAFCYCRRTNQ